MPVVSCRVIRAHSIVGAFRALNSVIWAEYVDTDCMMDRIRGGGGEGGTSLAFSTTSFGREGRHSDPDVNKLLQAATLSCCNAARRKKEAETEARRHSARAVEGADEAPSGYLWPGQIQKGDNIRDVDLRWMAASSSSDLSLRVAHRPGLFRPDTAGIMVVMQENMRRCTGLQGANGCSYSTSASARGSGTLLTSPFSPSRYNTRHKAQNHSIISWPANSSLAGPPSILAIPMDPGSQENSLRRRPDWSNSGVPDATPPRRRWSRTSLTV
ncbi:hypothetical protein B0H66DRAFT_526801 [Apodospora peruviana]|uniref:Uncharacterized protein n=1 Tax=Apodospora peruviana TaxID=516989 RepID=A0AAE0MEB7_9PEZI|nr:hypothetical protein B0H66DRAFT_526801 [Apodospora peruviana]